MEPIRLKSFVNQRVLIKMKGKSAHETTVIAIEDGGYWTRDGESPVEFLPSREIQWIVMADSPYITPEMRSQQ